MNSDVNSLKSRAIPKSPIVRYGTNGCSRFLKYMQTALCVALGEVMRKTARIAWKGFNDGSFCGENSSRANRRYEIASGTAAQATPLDAHMPFA